MCDSIMCISASHDFETHKLTPQGIAVLEKLTVPQVVKNFHAFYATRRLNMVSLPCVRSIHSTPSNLLLEDPFNITSHPPTTPRFLNWSPSLRLPHQNPDCMPHAPSNSFSYLLVPLRPKYSPQHTILKQWRTQEFCSGGGSTNSVEDRGQRERGSEGGSPLVRGSAQFANE
jgi:hypothetical protein